MADVDIGLTTKNIKERYVEDVIWIGIRRINFLFLPANVDNPTTVALDAAEGSGSDPAQVSIAGLVVFNARIRYQLRIVTGIDKLSATQEAVLFYAFEKNGVLDLANTMRLAGDISNSNNVIPLGVAIEDISDIGDTLAIQFWTDSAAPTNDMRFKGTLCTLNGIKAPCLQMKLIVKTLIGEIS